MSTRSACCERLVVAGDRRRPERESRYALERAAQGGGPVLFVATGLATDEEMAGRIARHRAERPPGWRTLEARHGLAASIEATLGEERCVLIEDLATLVSNLLVERSASEEDVRREVADLLRLGRERTLDLVVVTNEVGLGVVPPSPLGRLFRDLLGFANQQVAAAADEVVLLVAGLPLRLKP